MPTTDPHRAALAALLLSLAAAGLLPPLPAWAAAETFKVTEIDVADPKPVFGTVESTHVVPARARIGGTIVELAAVEGARVQQGDVVAVIGDEKLALQIRGIDAQIGALEAQLKQAQADLSRGRDLLQREAIARARFDQLKTAVDATEGALKSARADRARIAQQVAEGRVLAPASGRILKVPLTEGSVVLPGEAIVQVATENYILRLRLPERHARHLKAGDEVRLGGSLLASEAVPATGTIRKVYPEIEDGRVVADAEVQGIGDYFVGERVRVYVATEQRQTIVVPAGFLKSRYGMDFARLAREGGDPIDVPVQRGQPLPRAGMPDAVEILSGLRPGDVLVRP